jgi:arsenate reductase (thioredoxin)
MKKNILFLCTGNSCRSQMAEGWAKHYFKLKYNFYSAGTEKHGLNLRAVKVMNESGVDISGHYSKTLEDLKDVKFDIVFTVCGHAHENCPIFFGAPKVLHVGFDDPPKLSIGLSNEEEILSHYRRVRNEIENFTKTLESYLE